MLIPEEQARALTEKTLRLTSADSASVSLRHTSRATTRFSNNAITQNVVESVRTLSVSVAFGSKRGTATAAGLDDDNLKSAVRRAEQIARLAPPDPEYMPPLEPQKYPSYPPEAAYDPATARLTPVERAQRVLAIVEPAKKAGFSAAGTVESGESARAVANSKGLFAYHRATDALVGCTITAADSSGWARDSGPKMEMVAPAKLADEAIRQARLGAKPKPVPAGKYTTVLMPPAVGYFIYPLLAGLSARQTAEGLTFLSGNKREQLLSKKVTIRSDPGNTRLPAAAFDDEGLPVEGRVWVDRGVVRQMYWDRYTAQKQGKPPIPFPRSIVMEGTEKSPEDLIAGTDEGILVTHFWYVRSIKSDETLQTGMTRDGLFWIEGGKIKHGLKQMRWNESSLGVFNRILDLSRPMPNIDAETDLSLLPALKVADFNFVSGTEF